jgi:hypothetical protein
MQNAPVFKPLVANQLKPGDKGFIGPVASNTTNITNNVTGLNLTDPNATAAVITNGIKYGTAVTVNTTTYEGVLAASKIALAPKLTSMEIVANRRAANGGYL